MAVLLAFTLPLSTSRGQAQELPNLSNEELPIRPVGQPTSSPWIPVARVDPSRSIQIRMLNRTDLAVEYALTTNEAEPRSLEPGGDAVLGEIPIPAYMVINPAFSQAAQFEFDITADAENQITVRIERLDQLPPGTNPADIAGGDSTFNIDSTGAIYIY